MGQGHGVKGGLISEVTLMTLLRVPYLCHFDSTSFVLLRIGILNRSYATLWNVSADDISGIKPSIDHLLGLNHKSLHTQPDTPG